MSDIMLRRMAMMSEQGGGGGGAAEVLLASGNYVQSTDLGQSTDLSIPVTVTGTATRVFVIKDSITSGVGQTYAWYRDYGAPQNVQDAFANVVTLVKYYNSSGGSGYAARGATSALSTTISIDFKTNPTSIVCKRYSNNYYIRADTYHWYIYGTRN